MGQFSVKLYKIYIQSNILPYAGQNTDYVIFAMQSHTNIKN